MGSTAARVVRRAGTANVRLPGPGSWWLMWLLLALSMVNLALLAAAAGTLLLAAGSDRLGEWCGSNRLRQGAAVLRGAARGLTLALVLSVVGTTACLAVAFLR